MMLSMYATVAKFNDFLESMFACRKPGWMYLIWDNVVYTLCICHKDHLLEFNLKTLGSKHRLQICIVRFHLFGMSDEIFPARTKPRHYSLTNLILSGHRCSPDEGSNRTKESFNINRKVAISAVRLGSVIRPNVSSYKPS